MPIEKLVDIVNQEENQKQNQEADLKRKFVKNANVNEEEYIAATNCINI